MTRHNSLTTAQANLLPCNAQRRSPTFSRKDYIKSKPINNLNEKARVAEKALPQVKMDENIVISERLTENTNKLRQLLLFLEPKGCMKERDDYALYIFSPNNR